MSFSNVYYKRTVGTERACYVCYKPTTTVLATINTIDFLYTCPGHLTDRGFASSLGGVDGSGGGHKMGLTDEEIAKVKEEWEQKQKLKLEKEKAKAEEREKAKAKDKDKDKDKEGGDKEENQEKESSKERSKSPKTPGSLTTPTPPTPTHERYALHRDYFAMRQAEHRKRRQATQAKELAPRLPGAPRGGLEDKY